MNNPYLSGNFAPIEEEVSVTQLAVTGQIPAELNGQLLRIGPNPIAADPASHHWFLGNGMVHGVQLREGRADWYRSRFVMDDELVAARGGAPVAGPTNPLQLGNGVANTNIVYHAGQRLALVEGGNLPVVLDADLNTVARTNFGGTLPGGLSAHPHLDPATGEVHSAVYSPFWDYVQHVVVSREGVVTRAENIPLPGQPMVHDCMITPNYFIVLDLPVLMNMEAAVAGEPFPYRWSDDYGARVGLLPRAGRAADITWHEVDPCYVFHPMNGFEDAQGRVVLDVVRHPRMFATDKHGPNEGIATLDRWTIDPRQPRVSEQRLDDQGQEFPRIDERLTGAQHRYGYSVMVEEGFAFGGLIKHDLQEGRKEVYDEGPSRNFMEAVFVPRSSAASEDDGWLMSYVYDSASHVSEVVILAAQDFTAGPIARVQLPQRVPYGFHGNWVEATAQ